MTSLLVLPSRRGDEQNLLHFLLPDGMYMDQAWQQVEVVLNRVDALLQAGQIGERLKKRKAAIIQMLEEKGFQYLQATQQILSGPYWDEKP